MLVRIAALADYASISLGDKLNILGIFSTIKARSVPIVHARFRIAASTDRPSRAAAGIE